MVAEINYRLLERLAEKKHPLLNIADDFSGQLRETPEAWLGEVFTESRTAHHLLDMAGIPHGESQASHLDARTWQALDLINRLNERLDRIGSWHSRETAPGGMVGDFCNECGHLWPCDSRRMATGTYTDKDGK